MDRLQLVNEAGQAVGQSEISGETSRTEDGSEVESCSVPEVSPCNKTVGLELRNPELETSASLCPVDAMESPPAPLQQGPVSVSGGDMACLVCFCQFSLTRLPKLLSCQHAFCAACLKMILRQEDHTWIISCPLCRKDTVVFGGLICSLQNLQHATEQLGAPDPDAQTANTTVVWHSQQQPFPEPQPRAMSEVSRTAAKRLILLLLLTSVLAVFILPFTSAGPLTWFLCFMVVTGGIISGVLCWDPRWTYSRFPLPLWTKKANQVA